MQDLRERFPSSVHFALEGGGTSGLREKHPALSHLAREWQAVVKTPVSWFHVLKLGISLLSGCLETCLSQGRVSWDGRGEMGVSGEGG